MTQSIRARTIALIGYGAIGRQVAVGLTAGNSRVSLRAVLVRPRQVKEARASLPKTVAVISDAAGLRGKSLDLVVECAGQQAVEQYGAIVLGMGIDLMVISTGAFADPELRTRLVESAGETGARILVPAGAIAGIDGLGALRRGGLHRVRYISTKPPAAWRGTPAEELVDLSTLPGPTVLFEGPAGVAARRFPKNANLAATVALSGLGFDATEITLVADPDATENAGRIEASGGLGTLTVEMRGGAAADNAKTSAVTAFSVLRAIENEAALLVI
jgi:aspartate dehydrogenase